MRPNIRAMLAMAMMMEDMSSYPDFDEPIEFRETHKLSKLDKSPKMKGKRVDVRDEQKIGRNEPCPCGSGMKYKKCCIKK